MSMMTETKVGLLVVASVIGLGWLSFQSGVVGNPSISNEVRVLQSAFDNVDGLTIGAKVKVAGVPVGDISDIHLSADGYATVVMTIRQDVPLASNVKAQVATSGLIGEKFVALTTDFAPEGVLPESVLKIPSMGSSSVGDLAANFSQVADDLKLVSASLRTALGGQENASKLSRIVSNLDSVTSRLDTVLNDEIKDGQIGRIVDGLAGFSEKLDSQSGNMIADLRESAASLNRILANNEGEAGAMLSNLSRASNNIANITDRLSRGEGLLGKMLTEDSSAIDDFSSAMRDIQQAAAKVNRGEGTIGRLLNDPATVDKIETALESITDVTGRLNNLQTEIDFYGYSMMGEDTSKGFMNITLRPRPTRFYTFGVMSDGRAIETNDARCTNSYCGEDFGKEFKISAQFGHVLEDTVLLNRDVAFRIGLKNNTFGLGADTKFLDDKLQLSADIYDIGGQNSGTGDRGAHVDLTAKYNIIENNLYAVGGYDNILNEKYGAPFVGIGLRFLDDDFKYLLQAAPGI